MNRNSFWAATLLDELVKAGLSAACLAPGSRSTPLVMAAAERKELKIYTHFDERSAAFFTLGLAKASQKPVALICTSGTAAVNFFPAIVEAHESAIPLLVLTADRPHELRNSGANQSINQVNLYGSFALWAVDMALPGQEPSRELMRSLRSTAARAYATANGTRKGVVQLNLPFRKPLEPSPVKTDVLELKDLRPNAFTQVPIAKPVLTEASLKELNAVLVNTPRGLIICGVDCPRDDAFIQALERLSTNTGFPILADVASGLRLGKLAKLSSAYDSFFKLDELDLPDLDIVIRFGKMPTSATLTAYLAKQNVKHDWQINASGMWADDGHHLSHFIQADETHTCNQLANALERQSYQANPVIKMRIEKLERETWAFWSEELPKTYFDGAIVQAFFEHLPNNSIVFVANSLSIRHADQFAQHAKRNISIYANRGASGIDGNISTALGLGAAQKERPLFMLIGDLSFYHDMNGLLAIQRCGIPITILLINNAGGGIFHRLPISQFEPQFTEHFLTPHDLDFSHTAQLYKLEHHRVDSLKGFREAMALSLEQPKESHLIEAHTDSIQDHKQRTQLMQKYQNHMLQEIAVDD